MSSNNIEVASGAACPEAAETEILEIAIVIAVAPPALRETPAECESEYQRELAAAKS